MPRGCVRWLSWLVAFTALLTSSHALASVERFAVILGNNVGARGDTELRYAEAEASRVQEVLKDLGGFSPANSVLLRGENAESVRHTLANVNDRIRRMNGAAETMLFVFYSGHADAGALHLGESTLALAEIEQTVRESGATLRLLVIDACRSGTITRTKGGRSTAPFAIEMDDRLAGQGMVVLTSTAANEDAQESDTLKGSFFTHAFVSGLLGAADSNGDGLVVLEEAYRHAYDATLRATSQSWVGPQHPSFRFDLRGQGNVVLTDLTAHGASRSSLLFPQALSYLVMAASSDGSVVGEVGERDVSRRLTVKPGRYFVRGRGASFLLEGELRVDAGENRIVADALLHRVAYARLVRKGGSDVSIVHGPQVGYRVRTPLANAASLCHGVFFGYPIDFRALSLVPRAGVCRSTFDNATLGARSDEVELGLNVVRSWDTPFVTLDVGVGLAMATLHQSFTTRGVAPDRMSLAGEGSAGIGVTRDLVGGVYVFGEVEAQVYVFSLSRTGGDRTEVVASFALRPGVGLGKRW